jgi:type II restriction enzyme
MSKSDKLRKTQEQFGGGRSMFNDAAKHHEVNVLDTAYEVLYELNRKYNDCFVLEKKLSKKDIASSLGYKSYRSQGKSSFIKPDGGIIYYVKNNKKYPVLITEAKKQGTNDIRATEGKMRQGKGNAIERAYKNHKEIELYCRRFPVFPYVIFAHGCDFEDGSSINDRLDAMTEYLPRNKIYTGTKNKIVNLFVRSDTFTKDEMYDIMLKVAQKSIRELENI